MPDYKPIMTEDLKKSFKKLKKNHGLLKEFHKKREDILKAPYSNKPLRNVLSGKLRFHLQKKSFVALYRVNEKAKTVEFLDIKHHDKSYKPMKTKKISRVQRLKQRKLVKAKTKVL